MLIPDREKVIKWLEKEIKSNDYWDEDYIDCIPVSMLKDILALLKAQEPRVLTWDELMALPHGEETNVPVVSEVKYPIGTWDKGTICKWRGAEFLQELVQDHHWYNRDGYNKIWRAWTALPTKK